MESYNTKQKQIIISFLMNNKDAQLTCEEISDKLRAMGTSVGKTTVYRHMERLVSDGAVRKLTGGKSKSALYQFIDESLNCNEHMHLKCLECGQFVHLGCDFMSEVSKHILHHHNFRVDNSRTVLYGLCEKCSEGRASHVSDKL